MRSRSKVRIYSIGHSTRPILEFIELLECHHIEKLIDIRTLPGSKRNPQFNQSALRSSLKRASIQYIHLPELGGLRKGLGHDSPNQAWKNKSFRGFADYMLSEDFEKGLKTLIDLAKEGPVAIMCAEAVPWRCHRSLVSDALFVRGIVVQHIHSKTRAVPHRLTSFAKVDGSQVTYPLEALNLG